MTVTKRPTSWEQQRWTTYLTWYKWAKNYVTNNLRQRRGETVSTRFHICIQVRTRTAWRKTWPRYDQRAHLHWIEITYTLRVDQGRETASAEIYIKLMGSRTRWRQISIIFYLSNEITYPLMVDQSRHGTVSMLICIQEIHIRAKGRPKPWERGYASKQWDHVLPEGTTNSPDNQYVNMHPPNDEITYILREDQGCEINNKHIYSQTVQKPRSRTS